MTRMTARVGKASMWVALTRGFINVLGLFSMVVMARLLVPADFGLVAAASAIFAVLMAITDMSMAQALIAHRNPNRDHLNTAWTLGLLRGLTLALLLAIAAPFLARFFEEERLTGVLWVFAGSILLTGLANPRPILLQKELVFWQDFVLQVVARLLTLVVSVAIAWYYRSYWALVLGTVAGQFAAVALSYCILPFLPRLSLRHVRELLGFSVWLTLMKMVNNLNWRLDTLLIGKFLGAATLGLYSMGADVASFPVRETTRPLAAALFPAFAKMRDEPQRLRSAYQRAQTLLFALALPIGFGMAMTADLFVLLLLGDKWLPAVIVVQVISIVAALQSIQRPMQSLAMAVGSTRMLFWRSLGMLIIRVPMIVLGLYLAGLTGLVYARLVSGVCSIFASCWIVRELIGLGMRRQIFANIRSFAAVAVMILAVFGFRGVGAFSPGWSDKLLELCACLALGGASYFGALFGLWRLGGKPEGAEAEIILLAKQAAGRLRQLAIVRPSGSAVAPSE